ncbi:MAG: NAD-dependent epimerase/dehydratase family protein [Planctomycetota bacterium]|jgi:UDP-glucose 4-epimerase
MALVYGHTGDREAGFIGSHLAEQLLKDGQQVVAIDNLSTGSLERINKTINWQPKTSLTKSLQVIIDSFKGS